MSLKREFVTHSSQKEQVRQIMQATQGNGRVGQVAEGVRRTCGQEPLLLFQCKRMVKAGYTGLGLASMSYFSRLWGLGTVFSSTGPGV